MFGSIFADAETVTWVTALSGVATVVGAGIAGLFAWLTSRDKLRYDARLSAVERDLADAHAQCSSLAAAHQHCELLHRDCETNMAALRTASDARADSLQNKIVKLVENLGKLDQKTETRDAQDKAEVLARVAAVEKKLPATPGE